MIVLQGTPTDVRSLTFSPGGRLAAPDESRLQLWDDVAAGGAPTAVLSVGAHGSVLFGPDERLLVCEYGKLWLYDPRTRVKTSIPIGRHSVFACGQSPDRRRVLFVQTYVERPLTFSRRWDDLQTNEWTVTSTHVTFSRPFFLDGEKRFLMIERVSLLHSRDWSFVTRDASTGKFLDRTPTEADPFGKLEISPDQRWLAAARASRVRIYSTQDLAAPIEIRNDSRKEFTGIAFHPSGRFLAATSNDNTVKLYDTQTWQMAHAFDWQIGRLRSIAFSPDGMLAAAGSDKGKIVVWDFDL